MVDVMNKTYQRLIWVTKLRFFYIKKEGEPERPARLFMEGC